MNPADITSRIWRYGLAEGGALGSLVFREDGRIGGYIHPNEAFWRLVEGTLEILDAGGTPSRRFPLSGRTATRWPGEAVATPHRFWLEPNTCHPVAVAFGDDILQAAKRGRFYLAHLGLRDGVYAAGEPLVLYPGAEIEPGATLPAGSLFRIGAFSYVVGRASLNLSVGRYCSIGAGLSVFGSAHPVEWLSSSPMAYAPHHQRFYGDAGVQSPPPIGDWEEHNGHITTHVGHDVWIGAGTLLKPGISIGNGAVVATRSIVTKDVPAYAVVAGSPARIVRYRFEQPLRDRLEAVEWWRYDLGGVRLDWRDAAGAAAMIEGLAARGEIRPLAFPRHDYAHEILAGRVLTARG